MAAADQAAPVALVPLNDPMTAVNGQQSVMKTDIFRIGVGQPMVGAGGQAADSPANYCKNMMQVGMARTAADEKQFSAFATPVPGTGSNLFTFLAARLSASWGNLGCGALLNAPDPVSLTLDANGVATAATFSPLAIGTLPGGVAATATPSATPPPRPAPRRPARRRRLPARHRTRLPPRHGHGRRPPHGHGHGHGHCRRGTDSHGGGTATATTPPRRLTPPRLRPASAPTPHAHGFGHAVLRGASRGRASHPGPDAKPDPGTTGAGTTGSAHPHHM